MGGRCPRFRLLVEQTSRMHYEIVGRGTRTLLVLPGWRLDSTTEIPDWKPVLEERPGWRAVVVDLPGSGQTAADHEGIIDQAGILSRVERLVDQLVAAQPLAVAGTSNGGALALGLAHRRPAAVRGVAVRVPMLEPDDRVRDDAQRVAFEQLPATYRLAHAEKVAALWEPAQRRSDDEFLAAIRSDPRRYGLPEALTAAADITRPALVVLGRQDASVGWEHAARLLAHLPRATVAVLDRAGHALPVGDAQERLWKALAHDWLDRVDDCWASEVS